MAVCQSPLWKFVVHDHTFGKHCLPLPFFSLPASWGHFFAPTKGPSRVVVLLRRLHTLGRMCLCVPLCVCNGNTFCWITNPIGAWTQTGVLVGAHTLCLFFIWLLLFIHQMKADTIWRQLLLMRCDHRKPKEIVQIHVESLHSNKLHYTRGIAARKACMASVSNAAQRFSMGRAISARRNAFSQGVRDGWRARGTSYVHTNLMHTHELCVGCMIYIT